LAVDLEMYLDLTTKNKAYQLVRVNFLLNLRFDYMDNWLRSKQVNFKLKINLH